MKSLERSLIAVGGTFFALGAIGIQATCMGLPYCSSMTNLDEERFVQNYTKGFTASSVAILLGLPMMYYSLRNQREKQG